MTCPDCDLAAKRRHHGFRANCRGCAARSLVRSPHLRRVQQAGVQDRQYRAKHESRECALRLYPTAPVTRVKDHNRAESILIAHWALGEVA